MTQATDLPLEGSADSPTPHSPIANAIRNVDGTEMSYAEAAARVEAILAHIESGQVDVDLLSAFVAEATHLINACKARLTHTETQVHEVLASLEQN